MQIVARLRNAILDALIATDGALDPAATFIGIATAIVNNGVNTVMSDVTPAPEGLAEAVALATYGAPYTLDDGRRVVDAALKQFRPAAPDEACVVVGWYLADTETDGNLLAFDVLPEPIPLPDENKSMSVVVRITVDPAGRWDASVVIDG